MISPGKIIYKYRHGFKTAYYRDRVRPRILGSPPVKRLGGDQCEIHVYTSSDDWLNAMWSLKSFYHFSEKCYKLCIHHDGTLGSKQVAVLRAHFDKARVVSVREDEEEVFEQLKFFPRCAAFRRSNRLSPKVFDFFFRLESERMLVLDSDVLFFRRPAELLRRIEDRLYAKNTFNRDANNAYAMPGDTAKKLNITLPERLNSGLGVVHRESLDLPLLEEALACVPEDAHFWRIEQTMYAVLCAKHGYEPLPKKYDVYTEPGLNDRPVRHYVGMIRHLMYREGLCQLAKQGFLEQV